MLHKNWPVNKQQFLAKITNNPPTSHNNNDEIFGRQIEVFTKYIGFPEHFYAQDSCWPVVSARV